MAITLNGSTGITTPADTVTGNASVGGTLSVTGTTTLTGAATLTGGIAGDVTSTGTVAMASSFKRNRIINGNMAVFQRGTAATASGNYCLDRWTLVKSNSATTSTTQSTDVPVGSGFQYSMKTTVSVATGSLGAAQYELLRQIIEGYNIADFNWGSSSAVSITISFWVKSTVTGAYSGSLTNGPTEDRLCPFSYTINASNTWEYKTVTVIGNTSASGTAWNTTNGIGLNINWYTCLGSNFTGGTAGVWGTAPNFGVPSANALASIGNTFAITGVQLEVGTKATPYEMQIYSDQLAQCQRYYEYGNSPLNTNLYTTFFYKVTKRAVPTVTTSPSGGSYISAPSSGLDQWNGQYNTTSGCPWTATAEL
jgi:hypothetical protein